MRVLNFNPGPAALPLPALERARDELLDFAGTGMSVMEHSHRGKDYDAVHTEAILLMRELYGVPDSHEVLFMTGGASQQFAQVPLSFLKPGESADYVVTGAWSQKAFQEGERTARFVGASVRVAADTGVGEGKARSYTRAAGPGEIEADPNAAYLHFTTNETIHGVQFGIDPRRPFPSSKAPLVVDMSSDFLWRKLDVSAFDLVYAGAQKNLGPSGVTLVIASKAFVARGREDLPKILQYRTNASERSLYNTPPTFAIYLVRNVLAWVKSVGGLEEIERLNREKAALLYDCLDRSPEFFRCPVAKDSRSVMNVVFRLPTEALEADLVARAKASGMVGIKGHRSVGGLRVSLYNAIPLDAVEALVALLQAFAKQHG